MPGPPPYGRSSTVRGGPSRTRAASRARARSALARAPARRRRSSITGSTSSGNSDTTPTRYIAKRSRARATSPTTITPASRSTLLDRLRRRRTESSLPGAPTSTITSFAPVASEVVHDAERFAAGRSNLEPLEIGPVILAGLAVRQLGALRRRSRRRPTRAPDPDRRFRATWRPRCRPWPRPSSTSIARSAPCCRSVHERKVDDVVARLGVRVHLEPPLHAEHAADAAEGDQLVRFRAHCGIAERAGR